MQIILRVPIEVTAVGGDMPPREAVEDAVTEAVDNALLQLEGHEFDRSLRFQISLSIGESTVGEVPATSFLDEEKYPYLLRYRADPDCCLVFPVQSEVEQLASISIGTHHGVYTHTTPIDGLVEGKVGNTAFVEYAAARGGWTFVRRV